MVGVSRPTLYGLLNSGRLPSVYVGSRRLISVAALERLVNGEA
jgi:excisionase family DNA binding protein